MIKRLLKKLFSPQKPSIGFFLHNLMVVVGLVLIWRGVWYVLDWIDLVLFNGNHVWLAAGGIVLGFVVLYLPDRDLKEIQKL